MTSTPRSIDIIGGEKPHHDACTILVEQLGHTARSYPTVEKYLNREQPAPSACLLLEHREGDRMGLALLAPPAQWDTPAPVVVVGDRFTVADAVEYLRGGAVDVLSRPYRDAELRGALASAVDLYERRHGLLCRYRDLQQMDASLNGRERVVLEGILNGKLNRTMAKELEVSMRTLESIRARLYEKYGVGTSAELAARATERQLLAELVFAQRGEDHGAPARPSGGQRAAELRHSKAWRQSNLLTLV